MLDMTAEFNLSGDGSVFFTEDNATFLPHQGYIELIEHNSDVYPYHWRNLTPEALQDAWLNIQDILLMEDELGEINHLSMV